MNMLSCDDCLLRQFDADCKPGLPIPADVVTHLNECAACQQEWHQQSIIDSRLRLAMQADVPASVYRRAYIAAVTEQETKQPELRRVFRLLYAGFGGAAAAQLWLIVPFTATWPVMAIAPFVLVAGALFLYDYYDECQLPAL